MTLELFSSTSTSTYNPGPGQYELDPYRTIGGPMSVKCAIRPLYTTKPPITSNIDYMPPVSTLSRGLRGIGSRVESRRSEPTVGPSYLPDSNENFRRGTKIKSRYKDPDTSTSPGPGHYEVVEPSKTNPPPMGARPEIVLCDVPVSPGPAAYEITRDITKDSHKFSIRPITAPAFGNDEDPGFTYNNPPQLGEDSPKYTISRNNVSMFRDVDNGVPGPGAYEQKPIGLDTKIAQTIHPIIPPPTRHKLDIPYENTRRFPGGRKTAIGQKCGAGYWVIDPSIPGPNWLPDSSLERRSITIRDRIQEKPQQQTPGPCTYNPSLPTRASDPAFTFKGPAQRNDWLPTNKETPGPGYYNINSGNSLPKWTIGERSIIRARNNRAQTALNRTGRRGTQRNMAETI